MNKKYYYAIHVKANSRYGYLVAIISDDSFDIIFDKQKIIELAMMSNLFEKESDSCLVDSVYEIDEKEYEEIILSM